MSYTHKRQFGEICLTKLRRKNRVTLTEQQKNVKLFTVFFSFGLTVVIVGLDDASRLERSGYDKRGNTENILKGQSLFDVHPDVSDRFTG